MKNSPTVRVSLAIISIFLVLLAALLELYAGMAWAHRAADPASQRFGAPAILSLSAVAVLTVVGLIRGRTWAWWSTLTMAAMMLAFGLFCLVCAFRPVTPFEHSEFPFLIRAGIVFAAPAAITGVLLNIPPVRRRFLG